jgi:hypothetical protein
MSIRTPAANLTPSVSESHHNNEKKKIDSLHYDDLVLLPRRIPKKVSDLKNLLTLDP